jgi:lipopolysaccharide/colanic/teichoic acid biosynthesis glycosyltransferase
MPDKPNGKTQVASSESDETTKGGSLPDRTETSGFDRRLPKAVMMLFSELHRFNDSRAQASPGLAPRDGHKPAPLPEPFEKPVPAAESCPPIPTHMPIGRAAQIPAWKRTLDLACIFLTLPCWLGLMILVAAWIKIVSRGPLLYRQERVGYRGRPFMILKFRSMKVNVETRIHEGYLEQLIETDCPMTKLDASGDPRLILGARILRATGLDELPQILNVLRGEMSLVGPRPCTPHEFQRYQAWQQERVNTPPGLTGYWQVNGKNKTTFSEMIAMDLFYAYRMSALFDLEIILKTIPAIVAQVLEARARANARTWNKQTLVEQQEP